MYPIKQSTTVTIPFFLHDTSGNPVTGKVTGDFTKFIKKGGGAFASLTATVTEAQGGWYDLALTTSHTDTLGILTIYMTCSGAMQVNLQFRVELTTLSDLFDASNGLETGLTLRQALKLITAATAGDATVSGTTVTFKNPVAEDKTRITATVDATGNRNVTAVDVS